MMNWTGQPPQIAALANIPGTQAQGLADATGALMQTPGVSGINTAQANRIRALHMLRQHQLAMLQAQGGNTAQLPPYSPIQPQQVQPVQSQVQQQGQQQPGMQQAQGNTPMTPQTPSSLPPQGVSPQIAALNRMQPYRITMPNMTNPQARMA